MHEPPDDVMKGFKMLTPQVSISDDAPYEMSIFNVRLPGIAGRLHRERAAWQECGDIEALDSNHYVLIVRPGLATRLAA